MIDSDSPRARWLITSLEPLFTTSISHIDLPHPASINQKSSATLPPNHDQTPNQAQSQAQHQPPQPSRFAAPSALATPNTTTPPSKISQRASPLALRTFPQSCAAPTALTPRRRRRALNQLHGQRCAHPPSNSHSKPRIGPPGCRYGCFYNSVRRRAFCVSGRLHCVR
jgi:hypothetical protein